MSLELTELGVAELLAGYRAARFTPTQVVNACWTRIHNLEPELQALVTLFESQSRDDAAVSTLRWQQGTARTLEGVPVILKDLFEIAGTATLAGSQTRLGVISKRSSTVYQRLEEAGAVVLAKAHTVEYAFGAWGTNARFGSPRNPWRSDAHYVAGGSSSGSGVAVAARYAPVSIGTDTGGSVRVPAAFNGVVGLKPTLGRISTHGVVPLSPSLDTPGVLARHVADVARVLEVLQGDDGHDGRTAVLPPIDALSGLEAGVTGLVVARLPKRDRAAVDAEVMLACDRALQALCDLGASVVDVALPKLLTDYAYNSLQMHAEAYALHGVLAEDAASPMDPAVRARILHGKVPADRYIQNELRIRADTQAFLRAIDGIDALVIPTALCTAPRLDAVDESTNPTMLTRFVNQLGLCALALPCGYSTDGLPISLQIICRGGGEALALRIGRAFEAKFAADLRRPPQSAIAA